MIMEPAKEVAIVILSILLFFAVVWALVSWSGVEFWKSLLQDRDGEAWEQWEKGLAERTRLLDMLTAAEKAKEELLQRLAQEQAKAAAVWRAVCEHSERMKVVMMDAVEACEKQEGGAA